jgi:hypothetical protein
VIVEATGAAHTLFDEVLQRIATELVQPTSLHLDDAELALLGDLLARLDPPTD